MPRKPNPSATKATKLSLEEFAEKYETYAMIYGDPLDVVFSIMADRENPSDLRLKAADTVMGYRFPRLKALDNAPADGKSVQIFFNGVPASVHIGEKPADPVLEAQVVNQDEAPKQLIRMRLTGLEDLE